MGSQQGGQGSTSPAVNTGINKQHGTEEVTGRGNVAEYASRGNAQWRGAPGGVSRRVGRPCTRPHTSSAADRKHEMDLASRGTSIGDEIPLVVTV